MKLRVPTHIKLWERLWASIILIYTFVATFIVWKTMSKYGVNPIVFFFVDAVTSWIYGISTARIVVGFIQKDRSLLQKYIWLAGVSFITPQFYILVTASRVPRNDYYTIFGVIAALAIFAIYSLGTEVKKARKKKFINHKLEIEESQINPGDK